MKPIFFLPFVVFVLTCPAAANAFDCTKASSPIDKLICATPELRTADETMSAAYFKLLRETSDVEFRDGLIKSQRRWLKVRSSGPDRFGHANDDKTDDREILLKMTRDRLAFLQTAEPIHVMERERKITSQDSGGTFAGFRTFCVLQPPPYGRWTYECWGDTIRQHNDRICSSVKEWASGHMTEHRIVSVLKNYQPETLATCSTGDATTREQCPVASDDVGSKLDMHWNKAPNPSEYAPTSHVTNLWKFDPDIGDPDEADRSWMHDCLFSSPYPPSDASRPGSKSDASGR
ncbi:lysozyme inhibitor LprI family protein [Bradyrhizobium sp. 2TAF24]|uniref:lysozyme inhibitor LprI family protein n=1 Tax=Bradyrhizobium sp. 2TAF24 TaxID=3233011 RepID=UPI003F8F6322